MHATEIDTKPLWRGNAGALLNEHACILSDFNQFHQVEPSSKQRLAQQLVAGQRPSAFQGYLVDVA